MKIAKRRDCVSFQISINPLRNDASRGTEAPVRSRPDGAAGSMFHTPTSVRIIAIADTAEETATSRPGENGSSACPAAPVVAMKPAIIMIQAMEAAALRREGWVRL